MARCSICYTLTSEAEAVTTCPECRQEYHKTCWDELGGCGSYGCRSAAPAQPAPPPVRVATGWGDAKDCPSCRRQIGASLLVCSCGAKFPYADPMTGPEYMTWMEKEREQRSSRRTLVLLFIFSLLGVTAPVLGPIAGVLAWSRRDRLGGANGTFLAMGFGAAALGAIYLVIIALLALGK